MRHEYGRDQIVRDDRSVVTVGTFDGVHRGHQAILRYLMRRAREQDGTSVVVSFDPHPRTVVAGEDVPLLTTVDERAEILDELGLDRFIVLPFTKEFSKRSAESFVRDILLERIGLQEVVIGYDFSFGRGREGDSALLEAMGREHGFTVDVIPAQVIEEHVVSSTQIRRLLQEGDVSSAAGLLGRWYRLTGTVVEGEGRGHAIGYPTANLSVTHPQKLIPRRGVYAVLVRHGRPGTTLGGMMNVGRRPTFEGEGLHVEVHLFGYDGDLYGEQLRVEFVERIRNEQKFRSVDALVQQLSQDEVRCKEALKVVD